MITDRYVISTVTGFSILIPFLAFHAWRARALTGLAIASAALLSSMFIWYTEWNAAHRQRNQIQTCFALLDRAPDDTANLPVVFESPLRLFEVSHYSERALAKRFVFLADPESSVLFTQVRYSGHGLTSLQRYAPMRLEPFASFRRDHPRFLLYETTFVSGYVLPKLLAEGRPLAFAGPRGRRNSLSR
jgi:hypothetical protein